jgi:hypothetical protein
MGRPASWPPSTVLPPRLVVLLFVILFLVLSCFVVSKNAFLDPMAVSAVVLSGCYAHLSPWIYVSAVQDAGCGARSCPSSCGVTYDFI